MPFPLQRQSKRVHRVLAALILGVPYHSGVHKAKFLGLSHSDVAQVLRRRTNLTGHPQVVHAVDGFGAGYFLEDLGHLWVAFFQRLVGVGVVFQVGHRLPDDGVPEVSFRFRHGR